MSTVPNDDTNPALLPGFTAGLIEGYARAWGHKPGPAHRDDGGFAERFLEARTARVLLYPAVPICVVNDAGYCTTHEGVHPSAKPRRWWTLVQWHTFAFYASSATAFALMGFVVGRLS